MLITDNLKYAETILINAKIEVVFLKKDAAWAIAICDAINRMAEEADNRSRVGLYKLKFECINEAVKMDCAAGWSKDLNGNWVLHLKAPDIGTACFHDRHGNVKGVPKNMIWTQGWTGNPRRPFAYAALADPELRTLLARDLDEPAFISERTKLGYNENGTKI